MKAPTTGLWPRVGLAVAEDEVEVLVMELVLDLKLEELVVLMLDEVLRVEGELGVLMLDEVLVLDEVVELRLDEVLIFEVVVLRLDEVLEESDV